MGRVLITGGWGFLGINTAWRLASSRADVLLLSRRAVPVPSFVAPFWNQRIRGTTGNIDNLSELLDLIKTHQVESIIHAAFYQFDSSGRRLPLQEVLRGNLQGMINVLESARMIPLRRVSLISSETVYFGAKNTPTLHEDLDLPLAGSASMDIAGIKRLCEQISVLYAEKYGMSVSILRLDRMYGPLSHGRRFPVDKMVEHGVAGKACDLSDTYGGEKANYTYIKDAAKGVSLVHLAPTLKHIIYNIAAGEMCSLFDFAEAVNEIMPGADIRLGTSIPPAYHEHPPLDIDRVRSEMGFRPDFELKRAIRDYAGWLKEGSYH